MKSLEHQTKQAFLFNFAFYAIAIILLWIHPLFSRVVISLSFMISMLWMVLVLREIVFSTRIEASQKIFYSLLIIIGNIVGGIIYFWRLRQNVLGSNSIK